MIDTIVHTMFFTIVAQPGRVVAMVTHLLLFTVVTADIMNIGSFGDRVKNKSMKKFHAGSSWDSNLNTSQ